jgi:formate-dependent nitrite reductase cytochrome c552 subunit
MGEEMKRLQIVILMVVMGISLAMAVVAATKPAKGTKPAPPAYSKETKACLGCHEKSATPVATQQWASSTHAKQGVGCFECHGAEKSDKDAYEHSGFTIAVVVSPKDCGQCHEGETTEFLASHHAKAGEILGSLDNVLGELVEGPPAANSGCKQCHGGPVKVLDGGKLDPATWPNTGIGRLNPDGSRGSCSACHSRHAFSSSVARQPENCGKCHLGPDHPQAEIYAESKHGIAFRAKIHEMNLDSKSWVLGKDYSAAPTCATCHMSATKELPLTHDVGARISWTLRPEVSVKLEKADARRADMQKVCSNCHGKDWVTNFYQQYDAVVELYNGKFAVPAKGVMKKLRDAGKLTPTPFDEELEWTYYELWHHEGRRARMGTAMMGPDYTQWHGFYEVAKTFYLHFLHEAEALLPGVTADVKAMPDHKWTQGLSKEEREKINQYYDQRYGK